jgi:hypothetical protein
MTNNGLGRDAPQLAEWIDLRKTLADAETVSSGGLPATLIPRGVSVLSDRNRSSSSPCAARTHCSEW